MMFIVIGGAGGLANAFVSNYALFCVCRFVAAMGILTATDPRGANKTVNISILPPSRTHGPVPCAVHNKCGTGGN